MRFSICVVLSAAGLAAQPIAVHPTERTVERYWLWDQVAKKPRQIAADSPNQAPPDGLARPFSALADDEWHVVGAPRPAAIDAFVAFELGDQEISAGRYLLSIRHGAGGFELGLSPDSAPADTPRWVATLHEQPDGEASPLGVHIRERTAAGFELGLAWGTQRLVVAARHPAGVAAGQGDDDTSRYEVMGGMTPRRGVAVELRKQPVAWLDASPVPWKAELADPAALRQAMPNGAWRVGKNFWTRLELPARGLWFDEVQIPAGAWFLSVQHDDDGWWLCTHDPAVVRAAAVDAFWCHEAPVASRVPLAFATGAEVSDPLEVALEPRPGHLRGLTFEIRYGPHRLTAPCAVARSGREPAVAGITHGWAGGEQRGATRIIYFDRTIGAPWDTSPGQVAIEFGQPAWKANYAAIADEALGKGESQGSPRQWRLGQNLWTNLDTRFPLRFGEVQVPMGYYYLALEGSAQGVDLLFIEPAALDGLRFDAWHTGRRELPVAYRAPLTHERLMGVAPVLDIQLGLPTEDPRDGTLEIRFGPWRLSTAFRMGLELAHE